MARTRPVKGRTSFQNRFTIIQTSQQMNSYCVRKIDVWLLAFPFECILPYDFNADLIKVMPYRISLMLIIRSRIFVKLFSHRGMMHYRVTTSDSMMFFPFLASSVVAPFLSSLLCHFVSFWESRCIIVKQKSLIYQHLAELIQSKKLKTYSSRQSSLSYWV